MGFIGKCFVRVAMVAVAVFGLSFAPAAQASFPGQNGKIAFSGSSAAGDGVHLIEPDGSGLALVIPEGGSPAWSADGGRLAFIKGRRDTGGVHVADAEGSGQTLIRAGSFSSEPQVTREDEFFEPAWSPDGGTIAYEESELLCAQHAGCFEYPEGVRAISPDGSGDRQLLPLPASDPSYSPDGTRIAWSEHRPFTLSRIHVSNADGTGDTVLTQADPNNGEGQASGPSWSPDGTRIVFSRQADPYQNFEIYVMNADGSNQTRLTFRTQDDEDPVWSPDGQRIAWTYNRRLWVMNADGSGQATLTPDSVSGATPDWQPLVGPRRADYKNASHFCKAERGFLGEQQFKQKYGNHGGCVSGKR